MGTNYYTAMKKCPECGNKPEGIHLGKSSMGWQFSFQYNGGTYYKNVVEMREWLKDKQIEDEYGDPVTQEDFWLMIEAKQKPEFKNHAEYVKQEYPSSAGTEHIINGYSFSDCVFS
jgi:hypothetical protein